MSRSFAPNKRHNNNNTALAAAALGAAAALVAAALAAAALAAAALVAAATPAATPAAGLPRHRVWQSLLPPTPEPHRRRPPGRHEPAPPLSACLTR